MPRENSTEGMRCNECGGSWTPDSSEEACPWCLATRLTRQRNRAWQALMAIQDAVEQGIDHIPALAFILAGSYGLEDVDDWNALAATIEQETKP